MGLSPSFRRCRTKSASVVWSSRGIKLFVPVRAVPPADAAGPYGFSSQARSSANPAGTRMSGVNAAMATPLSLIGVVATRNRWPLASGKSSVVIASPAVGLPMSSAPAARNFAASTSAAPLVSPLTSTSSGDLFDISRLTASPTVA